jgi:hypothetical protein
MAITIERAHDDERLEAETFRQVVRNGRFLVHARQADSHQIMPRAVKSCHVGAVTTVKSAPTGPSG